MPRSQIARGMQRLSGVAMRLAITANIARPLSPKALTAGNSPVCGSTDITCEEVSRSLFHTVKCAVVVERHLI